MASSINTGNIDGAYPVAGQDNSSQGFRDNFTNIKTNFGYAKSELEDLQTKAVLKAGLTGVALDNDMGGNLLYNVEISQLAMSKYAAGVLAGSVSLDYANGYYQTLTTSASITPITTNPGTISLGSVKGGTSSFKVRVLFPQGYTIADHGISLLQLNATKTDVDWTKPSLAFKQLDASGEATFTTEVKVGDTIGLMVSPPNGKTWMNNVITVSDAYKAF